MAAQNRVTFTPVTQIVSAAAKTEINAVLNTLRTAVPDPNEPGHVSQQPKHPDLRAVHPDYAEWVRNAITDQLAAIAAAPES